MRKINIFTGRSMGFISMVLMIVGTMMFGCVDPISLKDILPLSPIKSVSSTHFVIMLDMLRSEYVKSSNLFPDPLT